jgi:hypothetical protein
MAANQQAQDVSATAVGSLSPAAITTADVAGNLSRRTCNGEHGLR